MAPKSRTALASRIRQRLQRSVPAFILEKISDDQLILQYEEDTRRKREEHSRSQG
jgi:hypothetical protein